MYYFSCIFYVLLISRWSVSQQVYCFQFQGFYSKYCECDDTSCKLADGKLCAGHGSCKCGKCQCNADWTGEACECMLSEDSCRDSEGSNVCSDHGRCTCGTCNCDELHEGIYCENLKHPVSARRFTAVYEGILAKKTLCLCCLCSFLCVTKTFRTNK